MNNLLHQVELGKKGLMVGRSTGSPWLDKATLGIRKGINGGVVAKEKVGKSKWTRYHYIVIPYLNSIIKGEKFRWVLFSLEEPRVKVEADICSALIYALYDQKISRNRMLGIDMDDEGKPILITDEQEELVKKVYEDHIVNLFGRWTLEGHQVEPGLLEFYGSKVTPAQYEAILLEFAGKNGKLEYKNIPEKTALGTTKITKKVVNFIPHDDEVIPICIMDDYRLMKKVGSIKQTIDEALEVEVDLTQTLRWYFFMGILHINREFTNFERIKTIGKERYYPDTSLIKDTGNMGERKHFVISLFDPLAPGFESKTHFRYKIPLDNTYRSAHLIASRDTRFPQHARLHFDFEPIHFINYVDIC